MESLKEKSRRQIWVKRIAIIFFVVMLLLTFFSNTIMNHSLARVSTQEIESDTVSAKVRGSGTIESAGMKEIKLSESREVTEVLVKIGDSVQAGDVLLRLKEGESVELKAAEKELESLKETYSSRILLGEISSELVSKAENGGENYQTAQNKLQSLRTAMEQAKQKADTIQGQLTAAQNELSKSLEQDSAYEAGSGQSSIDAGDMNDDTGMDDLQASSQNTAQSQLVQQLTKELEQANKELETATEAHTKYLEDITTINELKEQYAAIQEKEQELAQLKQKSVGNEILADISGTVVSVDVKAGDTTEPEQALLMIQDATKGYTLSFSVTKEQAAKVKTGDEAQISNMWYYGDVKVVLSSIKSDPQQPGKNKILVFDVTGEVTAGESMTVSIGEKSRTYDYVVPNSAIREDKNGKFILVVKEKSSPLGNRYVATRIDVEILETDDSKTAVSGALEGGEYVITTSNKLVNAGDYVRLSK